MTASCLVKDPSKRPSAKKLLRHSFFKQARSTDYIARTLLEGLPALGDRLLALKVCDLVKMLRSTTSVRWFLYIVFYSNRNVHTNFRERKKICLRRRKFQMGRKRKYHRFNFRSIITADFCTLIYQGSTIYHLSDFHGSCSLNRALNAIWLCVQSFPLFLKFYPLTSFDRKENRY